MSLRGRLDCGSPLGGCSRSGQRGAASPGLAFSSEHGLGCSSIFCSPGLGCCPSLCSSHLVNPRKSRQSPDLLRFLLGTASSSQPRRQRLFSVNTVCSLVLPEQDRLRNHRHGCACVAPVPSSWAWSAAPRGAGPSHVTEVNQTGLQLVKIPSHLPMA